jgi:hypothetical protein
VYTNTKYRTYIFHQIFVMAKFDQDPDPDPHWFGYLDSDPHGGKNLDPDPHWNQCGSRSYFLFMAVKNSRLADPDPNGSTRILINFWKLDPDSGSALKYKLRSQYKLKMDPWRVCRPMVPDSHHFWLGAWTGFGSELKSKVGSGSTVKWKAGSGNGTGTH